MELLIFVPILLVMGAVAVVLALNEQPLPASAASAFAAAPAPAPRKLVSRLDPEPPRTPPAKIVVLPGGAPLEDDDDDESEAEIVPVTAQTSFSHTDVLLADALTEMIGLKAELYHLRSKIDNLNTEVARLSGGPPRTPPAASKKPIQLRKAA
jgi:hypothetical protein